MQTNLRITSGLYRNRRLIGKLPENVRPTSEKVRQSIFNILMNNLSGKSFLDLCSGSGIMSFEALSRDAKSITMVDNDVKLIKIIKNNIEKIKLDNNKIKLICSNIEIFLSKSLRESFDIIFLDPPFDKEKDLNSELENKNKSFDIYQKAASLISKNKILSTTGLLITEYFKINPPDISNHGFKLIDERIFGSIGIRFWKTEI